MAFNYSGDPSASPLDEVRFLIGDTDATKPELQDAEINYTIALVSGPNPPASGNFLAAAYCAEAVSAHYGNLTDKSVGDLHISYSGLQKNFSAMSLRLRSRAALAKVPVYVGGMSRSGKVANSSDPDSVPLAIKIDGMTELATLTQDGGDGQ